MDPLFTSRRFTHFGPSSFRPDGEAAELREIHARRPGRLRDKIRKLCLQVPGVYGMVARNGELLYVGKAKRLRSRLLSYFRPKSRDPKAGRIIARTRRILWEEQPSEFAALLRELELIRRWRPPANVHGQPGRRSLTFLCIGRRPAPYLFLSRRPGSSVLVCFGPLHAGRRAREAVRRLNDEFRLRDCPRSTTMIFAEENELFPIVRSAACLRYDIDTCLGPCAAACSRDDYTAKVEAARGFLQGEDVSLLARVERDMLAASAALEFERAATLRDKYKDLSWLTGRLAFLREARDRHSFIYAVANESGAEHWYLIRRGYVQSVLAAPCDSASRVAACEQIAAIFDPQATWIEPTTPEQLDGVLLVASWFRRHPEEYARTLTVGEARERCSIAVQ